MIYALDKLAPGTANYDTLLYGAEVKFYSARLKLSTHLETSLPNFFAAGDGAGITRAGPAGPPGSGGPAITQRIRARKALSPPVFHRAGALLPASRLFSTGPQA